MLPQKRTIERVGGGIEIEIIEGEVGGEAGGEMGGGRGKRVDVAVGKCACQKVRVSIDGNVFVVQEGSFGGL